MRFALSLLFVAGLFLAPSARAAGKGTQALRYPTLTPDGKQVVFCYRGDVWIAPVDGKGRATRLTLHEAQETLPRVSPDGKLVAFTSRRNGNYDIYTVPVEGGVPKRITFHGGGELLCDWSPDGEKVLYMSQQAVGRWGFDLWESDRKGGPPRRITYDGGRDGCYSPDGSTIVYARGFNTIYWDNYEGSANYDLYVIDRKGGLPRRLTHTKGNERYPCFSKDAQTIWFVAEEKGVANFYSIPFEGGKRVQVTKYTGADVHRPDLAWDLKTVVFERIGQLYTTDITAPAEKPNHLKIKIASDVRDSGIERRTITSGGEQVHVSMDGRQVAFTLRGDVWTMPAAGGQGKQLTKGPHNDQWPRFSPDGTKIAYFSNAAGNNDIFIRDLKSGDTRQVTKSPADDFFHNWSPDGLQLVFTSERSGNREIWILDLESGQTTQLTRDPAADDDPTFSPDGRFVAFDSGRGGTQAIYVMNRDGTNVRRVSQDSGFLQVPCYSPDGRLLVYESWSPMTGRSLGLFVIAAGGGPSMRISRDGKTACWSALGDYIYFTENRGGQNNGIWRVKAPDGVVRGERVPFIGHVDIDLRKELGELFDEMWNALRDGFYDEKRMTAKKGEWWKSMKTKYRAMAIDTENKDEFHSVVRQMLAELGASHLGIFGGQRPGNSVTPPADRNGYFGFDVEQDPLDDGSRRVAAIVPKSPADEAGMRVGDVVTRINKAKLRKGTNLDKTTVGLVGKPVEVRFKPRTESGLGPERSVEVEAIDIQKIWNLKYEAWVATCARRVEETTKKEKWKLGYIHLRGMNNQYLQKFRQAVTQWNKNKKIKGMVLDVRNNGGGRIHLELMQVLTAKPLARVKRRGRPAVIQPGLYWDKPVVLLINERSFSDAEVFPHMFREAGLGTIVGVPTAGGVIGTGMVTLSDGSSFRIPGTGFKTMDGKDLEGLGVEPDILIEETSEDRLEGRDPQLRKALEIVMAEVRERVKAEAEKKKKAKPAKKEEPGEKKVGPAKPAPDLAASERNPLADARAGEWVRYRLTDPTSGEETVLKVSVARIEGDVVFFEKEIEEGGLAFVPLPEQMKRASVLEILPSFGKLMSHSTIDTKVKEEATRVLVAQIQWPDGSSLRLSFTNAVPGYGLLKVEMGKMIVLEAVEWGEAPAPEAKAEEPEARPAEPEPVKKKAEKEEFEVPAHPIFDAKVGEWVKIRRFGPGGQSVDTIVKVTEVTDDEVAYEQTVFLPNREVTSPTIRRDRREKLVPPENLDLKGYSEEEVTVGENTFDCVVMTVEDATGAELKIYYCQKVPFNGVVRMERDGETIMEIVEWGTESE